MTLLELVHLRLGDASPEPLQELAPIGASTPANSQQPSLSEQSVLVLTLIDALPFLTINDLEDWLPLVAASLPTVQDEKLHQACSNRFWDIISNGEMEVERAALCVAWWNSGGRDLVLSGAEANRGLFMSGALPETSKL